MRSITWIAVALVVVAAVAAIFWAVLKDRRRETLRSRFGPEYDRMVAATGDRREAEARLGDVADRRDHLDVRHLDPAARAHFDAQWDVVQSRFVDEPGQAVADADSLVTAVMRERGYPVDEFEERASLLAADHADLAADHADLAADHADVVQHYRAAHDAHARHMRSGATDTEDLRQAFVHYRSLYGALTGDVADRADAAAGSRQEPRR